MHAYMKGYQDGRGRKDPGFDFGGILKAACWMAVRDMPEDRGDGEPSRRRRQILAGAFSQVSRLCGRRQLPSPSPRLVSSLLLYSSANLMAASTELTPLRCIPQNSSSVSIHGSLYP